MKTARLLWSYSEGIRMAAILLLAVSCYALFSTVGVVRSLKNAYDDYLFIRDTDLHASYSFVEWNSVPRSDQELEERDRFYAENGVTKLLRTMESSPAVESLGTMGFYRHPLYSMEYYDRENPDSVPEEKEGEQSASGGIYIYTINPGMFDFFPNLKKILPFEDPQGVYIIGDSAFEGTAAGDLLRCYTPTRTDPDLSDPTVQHRYPGFLAEFSVEGRFGLPFTLPRMGAGGSEAREDSIVEKYEEPFLLMLDTEENRERLSKMGFTPPEYDFSFYLRYREDAAREDVEAVEALFNPYGGVTPLEEVQKNLAPHLKQIFLDLLPGAVVRTSIMLLCYVSLIALTVSKKRKEIAVAYICGATREKNAGLLTALLFLATVPAGIASLFYIYFVPDESEAGASPYFTPSLAHFAKEGISVCTVLLYFAAMLLLGWILVKAVMGKRSPVVYFKEVNK